MSYVVQIPLTAALIFLWVISIGLAFLAFYIIGNFWQPETQRFSFVTSERGNQIVNVVVASMLVFGVVGGVVIPYYFGLYEYIWLTCVVPVWNVISQGIPTIQFV